MAAAVGGHVACARYLVEEAKADPAQGKYPEDSALVSMV